MGLNAPIFQQNMVFSTIDLIPVAFYVTKINYLRQARRRSFELEKTVAYNRCPVVEAMIAVLILQHYK